MQERRLSLGSRKRLDEARDVRRVLKPTLVSIRELDWRTRAPHVANDPPRCDLDTVARRVLPRSGAVEERVDEPRERSDERGPLRLVGLVVGGEDSGVEGHGPAEHGEARVGRDGAGLVEPVHLALEPLDEARRNSLAGRCAVRGCWWGCLLVCEERGEYGKHGRARSGVGVPGNGEQQQPDEVLRLCGLEVCVARVREPSSEFARRALTWRLGEWEQLGADEGDPFLGRVAARELRPRLLDGLVPAVLCVHRREVCVWLAVHCTRRPIQDRRLGLRRVPLRVLRERSRRELEWS